MIVITQLFILWCLVTRFPGKRGAVDARKIRMNSNDSLFVYMMDFVVDVQSIRSSLLVLVTSILHLLLDYLMDFIAPADVYLPGTPVREVRYPRSNRSLFPPKNSLSGSSLSSESALQQQT